MAEQPARNADHQKVTAVVVHWKHMADTLECMASLANMNYPAFDVIVVNNGSPDFDEVALRRVAPSVVVIQTGANLGFTGGNNRGIHHALDNGADFVLLLNNDTTVEPGLIDGLLPHMADPAVGIVGPAINYYDAPDRVWFMGGFFSRWAGYSYRLRPLRSFPGSRQVDWINGCAMLIRRQVIEAVGDLWEPFFLNCEDLEFCLRAGRANFVSLQTGQTLVYHKVSASGGVRGTDQLSADKAYYLARNHLLLVRHHLRSLQLLTALLSQFFLIMPFWMARCARHAQWGAMAAYLHGLADGLRMRGGRRRAADGKPVLLRWLYER